MSDEQVPTADGSAVTSDVRAALQSRGARLGASERLPADAGSGATERTDLLLAPVFDDARRREIAHERIEATLARPRLRSLLEFLD